MTAFRRSGRIALITLPGPGTLAARRAALGPTGEKRLAIHLARLLGRLLRLRLGLGLHLFLFRFLLRLLFLFHHGHVLVGLLRHLLLLVGLSLRRCLRLLRSVGRLVVHRQILAGRGLGHVAEIDHQPLARIGRLGQREANEQQQEQHQRRVGERRRRADDTLLRAVLLLKVDHMPSIRAS